jgi:hypothetical protein
MADTAYFVRFKRANLPPVLVIAETIGFYGKIHGSSFAAVRFHACSYQSELELAGIMGS